MKDIKHLDESITQYEEMHARQDLQAFKELLDATKSLLAEHSSRDRSMGSYQSGAFGKLPSVQRFMVAYEQVTAQLNDRMGIIQAALERDQVRMEALHAEERTKQGLMNLVFGVLTFVAGLSALAMSGGTALPIVAPMLKIAGVGMYLLGSSNSFEGVQNIILGSIGDGKTVAVNPIRDTIFFGNAELYNHVGQVFSLTTGLFIPIAQTQSITQGISQFFWGTVGSIATGQAAYHGTKLLGGNEETAQLMNLFGNLVGGYKFSKIAENFSLNTIRMPKVESALQMYNMDDLAKLQHTENFTEKSLIHIFEGDINRKGRAGGYHYDMVEGTSGSIIEGTKSPALNDAGVYEAKVKVNGTLKKANGGKSTFFPDHMSPQEVVDTINEAYSNKIYQEGSRGVYIGNSKEGIKIKMFLTDDGKIITAYPTVSE